jgi:hypothetical protein
MGVFQGEMFGMAFWHPMSDMPEQGFYMFLSEDAATKFIRILAGLEPYPDTDIYVDHPLNISDLSVEPFDYEEHDKLIENALEYQGYRPC